MNFYHFKNKKNKKDKRICSFYLKMFFYLFYLKIIIKYYPIIKYKIISFFLSQLSYGQIEPIQLINKILKVED